jgi:tRNA(Ile)-lysidine synthase
MPMHDLFPLFTAGMTAIGGFESAPALAVAVSGGADSMALAHLAQRWAAQRGGRIACLTVDHGLRDASQQEAEQVKAWCATSGIEHHTLAWKPGNLASGIPMQARQARYRLMSQWCREHAILHLLTGHHRDDQAETLFFRLARHSGIDGLAAMPMLSDKNGIRLLRPLLHMPKTDLQALLTRLGQPWIEDPTNRKLDYTRNAVRHHLHQSGNSAILSQQASSTAQRFGAIRHHLDIRLAHALPSAIAIYPQGYATLACEAFRHLPRELGLRALTALTVTLSGNDYPPRSEKLLRLYNDIIAASLTRRTCGGLIFHAQPARQRLLIYRETASPPLTVAPGQSARWDSRFRVQWHGQGPAQLTVKPLGPATLKQLCASPAAKPYVQRFGKSVIATFPAFWNLEELVAVPYMAYMNADYRHLTYNASFCPAKPLAANAFFSMNTSDNS